MINFDASDKLLNRLNIYADKDIFSIMLNYIFNKYSNIYGKSLDIANFNNDLFNVHKKYKDNLKHKNSNYNEESKTIKFTINFIDYLYKNVFQYINISIFLKMNLIYFREREVEFNNYKLLTDFFDYIFINYKVNNYMDYLYQYKYIEPKIYKFGGEKLKEDIDTLFNGMGLNVLFNKRLKLTMNINNSYDELNPYTMYDTAKLSEQDRYDLAECIILNKKLCNNFETNNPDEQQIMVADYMLQRKLNR